MKKIIGSIGILAGLGLAAVLVYVFVLQDLDSRPPAPAPGEEAQVAVRPEPGASTKQRSSDPGPVVFPKPAASKPAPAIPPPTGKKLDLPPLEPTKEPGLLAGQFRTFESAKKRMEKIKKQGFPAFIRQEGKFYEVWAGPFATPEEAEKAEKSLKLALKISPKKRTLEIPVPK